MPDSPPRRIWGKLFLLAFVTGFSGAIMPGPLLVATIGQTTVQGFRAVIGLITGHAILELVIVGLLVGGLHAVINRPRVRGGIGLVGGAALLWMGWDMIAHAADASIKMQAGQGAYSWAQLLIWGAGLCAANPYFTGWWATIGAGQLAHMAPRSLTEYLAFYLGHEASDYVWYSIVGLLIVSGKDFLLRNVTIYHGLIYGCGIVILLLGLWFVYTGIRFVSGRVNAGNDQAAEG